MDTQTIVAVIGFGTAAVGLLATVLGRKKEIIHRHLHGQEEPDTRPITPMRRAGIRVLVAGSVLGVVGLGIAYYSDVERARAAQRQAEEKKANDEKAAKAARAKLVLSCDDKPVIKLKKGNLEETEVPPITIKIDRIECRGEVMLRVGNLTEPFTWGWQNAYLVVPDGQSVVTWKLRAIHRDQPPAIGINVIRVVGELRRYGVGESSLEGAVDIRVEVVEAP